jgi:hypothetical protein
MTVAELIARLSALPLTAKVGYAWDGGVRSSVDFVFLSRGGDVVISDGDVIYYDEDRPAEAPTSEEDRYWCPKGNG